MPEIIPINSTVHFKAAFDVKAGCTKKPMTYLRQKLRSWCINKVASSDQILHRSWFYIGNNPRVEPAQYHINEYQLRTVAVPTADPDEPACWAFEMIHPDSDERARRWSVEITLRKNDDDSVRFTTIVRHWMIANYIGEYPAPPTPSAPAYVRAIIDDHTLSCSKGDAKLGAQPIRVTNKTAQAIYDALMSDNRQVPFVFIAFHAPSGDVLIPSHRVANALIGNANVYVLSSEAVVDEMNYYLGQAYSCESGTVRVYLPQLDKADINDSRRHRYLSASFITQHGEEQIVRFLTNGLSRNGSTFKMSDLTSFADIFSVRRKFTIRRLAAESDGRAEEASMVWEDNEKLTTEVAGWESTAIQYESENSELTKTLASMKFRIDEAERVRHRLDDLESQLAGIRGLATPPRTLADILRVVAGLFPNRIEIADNAIATAESYADEQEGYWGRLEGLAVAWEMVFGAATRLYELVFDQESNRLEEEFSESFSKFELALTEGKQTKKDAKLMGLRRIEHNGEEIDITPHIKFGNRKPKLIRLYFAIRRDTRKVIVGHFGDHLDNYTTKKR